MDGFVTAHFLGWLVKALIFRDIWMTMVISAAFELLEYTFEHQLPNFSECWWDHVSTPSSSSTVRVVTNISVF